MQTLRPIMHFSLLQHVVALVRLSIAMETNVLYIYELEPAQANHPRLWRNILTTLRTESQSASELDKEAKESIDELVRSTSSKLDNARDETGDALHAAAASVRTKGRQGSEAIDNLATGTADRLDATASYIEDFDLRDVFSSLRRFGRRHLTGSLLAAAAIGFVAGSALSRATHSCGRAPKDS